MEFNVGDRVEYIGNNPYYPLYYGDKGTVIAGSEYKIYDVEWDKRNLMMHDGDGNGKNHHCWCVREREIRKVKEEKKTTENEVINTLMEKLDVEIGEPFDIIGPYLNPHHFDEKGNLIDGSGDTANILIGLIIVGNPDIKKIPVKEMTVSQIEKELGYKIKIIADKEEDK